MVISTNINILEQRQGDNLYSYQYFRAETRWGQTVDDFRRLSPSIHFTLQKSFWSVVLSHRNPLLHARLQIIRNHKAINWYGPTVIQHDNGHRSAFYLVAHAKLDKTTKKSIKIKIFDVFCPNIWIVRGKLGDAIAHLKQARKLEDGIAVSSIVHWLTEGRPMER